ncbi:hypothetical protein [Planococcus sp. YIM B11945]|uniref:hypothetical protein n=1 Tax=Planococcus sp. YIM B11945 TaxID=3435410 RepID=UPI003D7C9BE2
MPDYEKMLDQLRHGEIAFIRIEKEDFLEFRKVLISQSDFKHFRGAAFHHGLTIYTYTEEPSK